MQKHDKNHDGNDGYREGSISLGGAVAMGTGVMIGAGIFALPAALVAALQRVETARLLSVRRVDRLELRSTEAGELWHPETQPRFAHAWRRQGQGHGQRRGRGHRHGRLREVRVRWACTQRTKLQEAV